MTKEQFKSLRRGDIIRGLASGIAFVVDAHYGDFVIAMKSMHVSNPSEWELCASENSGAVVNGPTTGQAQNAQSRTSGVRETLGAIIARKAGLIWQI